MTLKAENGAVELCCEQPVDVEFVKALVGTLDEWSSEHDENACRSLQMGVSSDGLPSQ